MGDHCKLTAARIDFQPGQRYWQERWDNLRDLRRSKGSERQGRRQKYPPWKRHLLERLILLGCVGWVVPIGPQGDLEICDYNQ